MDKKKRKANNLQKSFVKKQRKVRKSKWAYDIPEEADLQTRLCSLHFLQETKKKLTPKAKEYLDNWSIATYNYFLTLLRKFQSKTNGNPLHIVVPKTNYKRDDIFIHLPEVDRFDRFWKGPAIKEEENPLFFTLDGIWIQQFFADQNEALRFLFDTRKEFTEEEYSAYLTTSSERKKLGKYQEYLCKKVSKQLSVSFDDVRKSCLDYCDQLNKIALESDFKRFTTQLVKIIWHRALNTIFFHYFKNFNPKPYWIGLQLLDSIYKEYKSITPSYRYCLVNKQDREAHDLKFISNLSTCTTSFRYPGVSETENSNCLWSCCFISELECTYLSLQDLLPEELVLLSVSYLFLLPANCEDETTWNLVYAQNYPGHDASNVLIFK